MGAEAFDTTAEQTCSTDSQAMKKVLAHYWHALICSLALGRAGHRPAHCQQQFALSDLMFAKLSPLALSGIQYSKSCFLQVKTLVYKQRINLKAFFMDFDKVSTCLSLLRCCLANSSFSCSNLSFIVWNSFARGSCTRTSSSWRSTLLASTSSSAQHFCSSEPCS